MVLNIGRLKKRITVSNPTGTQDETGFSVNTYATAVKVWASVEPLTERELYQAQQAQSEATLKVSMRYNTSTTAESRLVHGSRTLEIVECINSRERGEKLVLLCKEVT